MSTCKVASTVSRDCAFRLEIQYTLPIEVTYAMLEALQEFDQAPVVYKFSQQVAGAKDLFQMRLSEHSSLQGLIGGNNLLATYGKFGEKTGEEPMNLGQPMALLDRLRLENKLNQLVEGS